MSDYILLDGDPVTFMANFGTAVMVVQPGEIKGTGPATINGDKICVEGDEVSVEVPGVAYTVGSFVTPGNGTMKIEGLASNQIAQKSKTGGKPMLLAGMYFTALFEVAAPAADPSSGATDPGKKYFGQGMFEAINQKHKGT